ncbi:unnamed protein product [Durusdinium trenchii]|uniref:Uncharacterized protein n=1 Tax=Durusdinium trenchii TaxID=1381693 RepID=A0ABP0IZN9_9DINO
MYRRTSSSVLSWPDSMAGKQAFLRENGKSIPLKFKWATDMEFVPYSEMMTYRCGVLVPNDLTMASFAEAYAMGFPLFLPVDEWLYRLQKSVPYGFMVHAVSLPGDHPSPFWQEKSRALTTVMMWLRLSDFSTWPFTQRFCSVPELLEGLMKTPLEKISLAMLEWMAKSQEEGLRRWSGLLHSLQQGSEVMSESSLEVLQESVFGPGYVSRSDLLYSALACEHEKFDKFGWPAFRSVVEANAVAGFPLEQDIAFFTDVALLDLGEVKVCGDPVTGVAIFPPSPKQLKVNGPRLVHQLRIRCTVAAACCMRVALD